MTPVYASEEDIEADMLSSYKPPPSDWKGRVVSEIKDFIYTTLTPSIVFIIGAIAAHVLFPPIAPALWSIAAALLITRLVVKVITLYNSDAMVLIEHSFCRFIVKRPFLQLIVVIALIGISYFFWPLGAAFGVVVGIGLGLLLTVAVTKRMGQVVKREAAQPTLLTT